MKFVDYDEGLFYHQGEIHENYLFIDYDGTIILQKNGKCPTLRKSGDWKYVFPNIPNVLKNFNVVIITNQKNIKDNKKQGFITQISEVFTDIKPWIFVAAKDDNYRKPNTGIMDVFKKLTGFNGKSFYVGDACGRKNDHSTCDLHFAKNLGWEFKTPEMFFNEEKNNIPDEPNIFELGKMDLPKIPDNIKILFLQGPPACGKSTIAKRYPEFFVINQDELKTLNKCVKTAKEKLKEGKKIIIDRTNPNEESMKPFMELNDNFGILTIKIDKLMNKHMNYYRAWKNGTKRIPDLVYNIYWSKYEEIKGKFVWEVEWKMEEKIEKKWFF